jgi:hypothetical protein
MPVRLKAAGPELPCPAEPSLSRASAVASRLCAVRRMFVEKDMRSWKRRADGAGARSVGADAGRKGRAERVRMGHGGVQRTCLLLLLSTFLRDISFCCESLPSIARGIHELAPCASIPFRFHSIENLSLLIGERDMRRSRISGMRPRREKGWRTPVPLKIARVSAACGSAAGESAGREWLRAGSHASKRCDGCGSS